MCVGSKRERERLIWIDSISPHLRPLCAMLLMHRLPSARWSPCSQPDNSAAHTHITYYPSLPENSHYADRDRMMGGVAKGKTRYIIWKKCENSECLCRAAGKQVMCEMRTEEMKDERRRRQWDMRGTGRKTKSWSRGGGRWRRLIGLCGTKTNAGGEDFNAPLAPAPGVNCLNHHKFEIVQLHGFHVRAKLSSASVWLVALQNEI